jgi:hypothetical protein
MEPRPFLAACETCGYRRPWSTGAEAVEDARRHLRLNQGHRSRPEHAEALLLDREGIGNLVFLIVLVGLLLLTVAPRLYRLVVSS